MKGSPTGTVGRPTIVMVAVILGMAVAAWAARGVELDQTVTPDESIWLARSANFYQALADGRLGDTYQYGHPGVTTMWAGAIGLRIWTPEVADAAPNQLRPWNNGILPVLDEAGIDPMGPLVAGRRVIVLFTTVGLVALGWYAVRLFGLGPGLVGAGLLALDPFHVALSQLLHVDALASVLTTLAAAAWLAYLLRGRRRGDLIVAGVALGLAGLTRSTAVVVAPLMVVSALVEGGAGTGREGATAATSSERDGGAGRATRQAFLERFRPVVVVGIIAVGTVVAAWPALWVSPVATVEAMVESTRDLAEEAHARAIFFDGRLYDGEDPGVRFYPTALVWRSTPAVTVGLAIAAVGGAVGLASMVRRRFRDGIEGRAAAYLALLAVLAVGLLSLSDKKFDRYVALAVPSCALVAGWGFGVAGRLGGRLLGRMTGRGAGALEGLPYGLSGGRGGRAVMARLLPGVGALLVLGVTGAETAAVRPYPLSYYNALLGGTEAATGALMVGTGEGFDQIAATLDAIPDVAERRVVTSAWEAPISYFTEVADVRLVDLTTERGIGLWLTADYYVWDVTSDQRGAVPEMVREHIAGLTPLATVRLRGVDYARVYDLRAGGVPAAVAAASRPVDAAGVVRLVATALPTGPVAPGGEAAVTLYLSGEMPAGERMPLTVALVDGDGGEVAMVEEGFRRRDDGRAMFSVRRDLAVPSSATEGTYTVVARFGEGDDGTELVLGAVEVRGPPEVGAPATPAADTAAEVATPSP